MIFGQGRELFLFSASSLTIWTSSFIYFVWTWGFQYPLPRSDYEVILAWRALHTHTQTRIMLFPSMLICHTTAMCFTLSIASPLLYTCSFTQRPKPSGGKGAKSLLKRQRGSAFVSEWAHLKRRKRDWQSLRTRTTYNPSGTDCLSYTLQWASPRPLISCAVNDPWSGGHQGIGMSLWNPLLTARHSCTSFTKKCF